MKEPWQCDIDAEVSAAALRGALIALSLAVLVAGCALAVEVQPPVVDVRHGESLSALGCNANETFKTQP